MLTSAFCLLVVLIAAEPDGVLPVGADGKPLNLDFETGDLRDWTATGDAFKNQPIEGDTVKPRRPGMTSRHQGKYWIGTFERGAGDKTTGTLTSVPFKVTHPYASFLIGGGQHNTTRVEVVAKDGDKVLNKFHGLDVEDMQRVVVDLRKHQGKEIFVRIVDQHTGGWGHINFDDFRFHMQKPEVAVIPAAKLTNDEYPHAGLSPEESARAMTVPEDFKVTLFAGEPDVAQPIGFCLDHRGRLWVAEAYTYPRRAPEGQGKDRILIFEDTNGDGKFDKRTVFMEGLNLVSGIEYGFGGLWIGAAPYLMFIPIDEATDKPAGPPKILLDGWAYEDTHETLNTFTWGPDGWLYGCHGVFTHSRVGKPGTPNKDRVPINAGIWRYHPTRHEFEVFAHGTSNPWGLDFDEHGQLFIEACVIPHCYHMIQGGRYERQAGSHFNPYTYADIKTIVDHFHYLGATPHGGNNKSDAAGGGHAHCGLLCYQGGTWPKEYWGKIFMGNIHGRRINMDALKPQGSGFVCSHGPDFLKANDSWARFINMRTGPDGNVYLIDWYDKQACHHMDTNIWDRTNGRIYKISYKGTKPVTLDLAKKTDEELCKLVANENKWFSQHSRSILQERAASKKLEGSGNGPPFAVKILQEQMILTKKNDGSERVALQCLWGLHGVGRDVIGTSAAIRFSDAYCRAWAIQLMFERPIPAPQTIDMLVELARNETSPIVRLYLASACQRLPVEDRWYVITNLLSHSEDATDHNLPLMYWYAAEPLAEVDAAKALALTRAGKIPLVHAFMCRRVAALGTPEAFALLIDSLKDAGDDTHRLMLLDGIKDGLKGRRNVKLPANWTAAFSQLQASASPDIRDRSLAIAVSFGDPAAFGKLRETLKSTQAPLPQRQAALSALVDAHDQDLAPVLQQLVGEPSLRGPAIRALAGFADAKTPAVLLAVYQQLTLTEKREALNVLVSRQAYAPKLLDAIAAKTILPSDVPAEIVRQLRSFKDPELTARLTELWGVVRDTPADRKKMMDALKRVAAPSTPPPDLSLGRAIFGKTCQQCHTLYGVGSKIGPDITGSNRVDLNYLVENIVDPSALIPKDYAATKLILASGRQVEGIIKEETKTLLTVATATETLSIPVSDVESRQPSEVSMMPEDTLKNLKDDEIRALIAYLRGTQQVPMLATVDNAKDFFNGKDLAGWDGDMKLWSVENGEIVGRSPGIPRNEFLKNPLLVRDFRLSAKVKLTPDKENSGIQFRSAPIEGGEMRGPQADVGAGWWGKLYDEQGRGLVWSKPGDQHVKKDDWNDYRVEAIGSKVRTWINGQLCVDLDDPKLARQGLIAFQIHSGGKMEVRFKDLRLEVLGPSNP